MKMWNRVLALVLALCLTFALAACSGGDAGTDTPANTNSGDNSSSNSNSSSNDNSSAAASSDNNNAAAASTGDLPSNVTVNFWTDQSIDPAVWEAEFARFAADEKYKDYNYSISIEAFAGADRATKVAAAIESNSLPDLALFAWFTATDWCHQGYVLDISDVVEPVKDQMYSSVYEETKLGGRSFAFPLYSNYWTMIYNADMLKDAGLEKYVVDDPNEMSVWTMSEFEEILAGVSANLSGDQYCLPLFAADNQADTTNVLFLSSKGGSLWSADGHSQAGDDANVVAALDMMAAWHDAGYTNSNIVSQSNNTIPAEFCNGQTCFSYGYYSNFVDYKNQMEAGDIDTFDIRLAAFPYGDSDYRVGNYVYALNAFDTGNQDQITVTKEFLKWLSQDKQALTNLSLAVSSYPEIAEDPDIIAANPMFESYGKLVDAAHILNFHGNVSGYVSTRSMLFPELQAFFGGEKDAQTAMNDYMAQANGSIQEYIDNSVILN